MRESLDLEQQVSYVGPTWLDRALPSSTALGAEVASAKNNLGLQEGLRILSVYPLHPARPDGGRLWIITEADRSATTFLLPEEY